MTTEAGDIDLSNAKFVIEKEVEEEKVEVTTEPINELTKKRT